MLLMGVDESATNNAMVEDLVRSRSLRSRECVAAFHAVDRADFWVDGSGGLAYADMPLRHGRLHQSAPHIYARALESLLPLRPGMSFLNVGSGTGYFSSLVAELTGDAAVNDGIDIWPELVAHAGERCQRAGKPNIEFSLGNAFRLDVEQCGRYDRIYVGACGDGRSQNLYKLLEVGGVLVGPFQSGQMQQLLRVVRSSETQFATKVLSSVQFASLVAPSASRGSGDGVPVILRERPWTPARDAAYPASFRCVADAVVSGRAREAPPGLACLPPELWAMHILPCCNRRWFESGAPAVLPSSMREALAVAGRAAKHVSFMAVRRGRSTSEWSATSTGAPSGRSSRAESGSFSSEESGDERNTEAGLLVALLDARGASAQRPPRPPTEGQPSTPGSRLSRLASMLWQCAGRCCWGLRLFALCRHRAPVPANE